jgi:hypothetical protein
VDWSYRELGSAFDYDHKTVKRHLALLKFFLSGNPTPEAPTPEEASDPLSDGRHSIECHFILYKLLQNLKSSVRTVDEIRNALAAEQTQIKLFLFRSQMCFDELSSSAGPGALSGAAEESRQMISLLPPATLEGTRIMG